MLPSCATDVTSISRSSVLPPEYLQALSNEHVQAVIVLVDGMFFQERKRIAQLAASADTARADRRGDRIEMPFAAAHESVVGTFRPDRPG